MKGTPNEFVLAFLAVALSACTAGGPEPARSALYEDAATLPRLSVTDWASAAAGCEGMLRGTESFAVTHPDGLVVALRSGVTVCVDTLPATEEELLEVGLDDEADALQQGYFVTMNAHTLNASVSTNPTGGEPNPQPSIETGPAVRTLTSLAPPEGEPNPQPSDPAEDGEPNPQPSRPGDSPSGNSM